MKGNVLVRNYRESLTIVTYTLDVKGHEKDTAKLIWTISNMFLSSSPDIAPTLLDKVEEVKERAVGVGTRYLLFLSAKDEESRCHIENEPCEVQSYPHLDMFYSQYKELLQVSQCLISEFS